MANYTIDSAGKISATGASGKTHFVDNDTITVENKSSSQQKLWLTDNGGTHQHDFGIVCPNERLSIGETRWHFGRFWLKTKASSVEFHMNAIIKCSGNLYPAPGQANKVCYTRSQEIAFYNFDAGSDTDQVKLSFRCPNGSTKEMTFRGRGNHIIKISEIAEPGTHALTITVTASPGGHGSHGGDDCHDCHGPGPTTGDGEIRVGSGPGTGGGDDE